MTLRTAGECLLLARQIDDKAERCHPGYYRNQYEALARGWRFIASLAERQDRWTAVATGLLTLTRETPSAPAVVEAAIRERLHQRERIASSLKLAFVSPDELPSDMSALLARV